MYEYFRGKLVESTKESAIIDVGGIGYKLLIPLSDLGRLPKPGIEVFLYASWIVRENAQTLFGFLSRTARDLFEVLITLSGIGPKTALSVIGHLEPPQLQRTVETNDAAALARVPGIGKKTAERLLVELRNKWKVFHAVSPLPLGKTHDAVAALLNLGYSRFAAEGAVKNALEELPEECDLAMLITSALKQKGLLG